MQLSLVRVAVTFAAALAMSACIVTVPEVDEGDFACTTNEDCVEGYECATVSVTGGGQAQRCRLTGRPGDSNTMGGGDTNSMGGGDDRDDGPGGDTAMMAGGDLNMMGGDLRTGDSNRGDSNAGDARGGDSQCVPPSRANGGVCDDLCGTSGSAMCLTGYRCDKVDGRCRRQCIGAMDCQGGDICMHRVTTAFDGMGPDGVEELCNPVACSACTGECGTAGPFVFEEACAIGAMNECYTDTNCMPSELCVFDGRPDGKGVCRTTMGMPLLNYVALDTSAEVQVAPDALACGCAAPEVCIYDDETYAVQDCRFGCLNNADCMTSTCFERFAVPGQPPGECRTNHFGDPQCAMTCPATTSCRLSRPLGSAMNEHSCVADFQHLEQCDSSNVCAPRTFCAHLSSSVNSCRYAGLNGRCQEPSRDCGPAESCATLFKADTTDTFFDQDESVCVVGGDRYAVQGGPTLPYLGFLATHNYGVGPIVRATAIDIEVGEAGAAFRYFAEQTSVPDWNLNEHQGAGSYMGTCGGPGVIHLGQGERYGTSMRAFRMLVECPAMTTGGPCTSNSAQTYLGTAEISGMTCNTRMFEIHPVPGTDITRGAIGDGYIAMVTEYPAAGGASTIRVAKIIDGPSGNGNPYFLPQTLHFAPQFGIVELAVSRDLVGWIEGDGNNYFVAATTLSDLRRGPAPRLRRIGPISGGNVPRDLDVWEHWLAWTEVDATQQVVFAVDINVDDPGQMRTAFSQVVSNIAPPPPTSLVRVKATLDKHHLIYNDPTSNFYRAVELYRAPASVFAIDGPAWMGGTIGIGGAWITPGNIELRHRFLDVGGTGQNRWDGYVGN